MVLSYSNIINYLLNRIAEMTLTRNQDSLQFDEALCIDNYEIAEIINSEKNSRNRCFSLIPTVYSNSNIAFYFFLKQPHTFKKRFTDSIRKEHYFYEIIKKKFITIKDFIPDKYDYDEKYSIIIIRFVDNSLTLLNKIQESTDYKVIKPVAEKLQLFHNELQTFNTALPEFTLFDNQYPSIIFSVDVFSIQNLEFQKKNRPELGVFINFFSQEGNKYLSEIVLKSKKYWLDNKQHATLIHGDFKLNNILISQDEKVWLIDWENAVWGDREWDLAIFYFSLFINFIQIKDWQDSKAKIDNAFCGFLKSYSTNYNSDKLRTYIAVRMLEFIIVEQKNIPTLMLSLMLDTIEDLSENKNEN